MAFKQQISRTFNQMIQGLSLKLIGFINSDLIDNPRVISQDMKHIIDKRYSPVRESDRSGIGLPHVQSHCLQFSP